MALSLERLVGIEEIDPAAATLTVRAGTPLADASMTPDLKWRANQSCAGSCGPSLRWDGPPNRSQLG